MIRLIKEGSWDTDFLHEVIWKLEDIFSDFGIESDYFNFFLDSDGDFGKFEMRLYVNDRQLELGKLEVRYYGEDGKFDEVNAYFYLSREAEKFCGKDFYRWTTENFYEGWDELYNYVTVTTYKIIDCYKDWYGIADPIDDEEFDESIKRRNKRMNESPTSISQIDGYAVDIHDMGKGYHHLLLFTDRDTAESAYDGLAECEEYADRGVDDDGYEYDEYALDDGINQILEMADEIVNEVNVRREVDKNDIWTAADDTRYQIIGSVDLWIYW